MAKYTVDVPIDLTDEQVAAIRDRYDLGPDDDLAAYVMLEAQEKLMAAFPGATVALEEVARDDDAG